MIRNSYSREFRAEAVKLVHKTTWAFSIGEDDTVLEYWAWVAFRIGRALAKRSPR